MTTRLITVCGTGEVPGSPTTMLSLVAKEITAPVKRVDLQYPASIALANAAGNLRGVSETVSRRVGVNRLRAEVLRSPEPAILAGYSLGALVVSDFLEQATGNLMVLPEIAAVVNIANPARHRSQSYGLPSFGYGLDGEHGVWPDAPVFEIANPVDMITSAPDLSPWRQLAIALRQTSLADPWRTATAFLDSLDDMHRLSLGENWTDPQWWRAYAEAPAWLRGYLFDGQHTFAYGQDLWRDPKGLPTSGISLAAQAISDHV